MSEHDLEKMSEEDKKLYHELVEKVDIDKIQEIDEILGFKLAEPKCFIPAVACGTVPAKIMSLVPLYQTVFTPIQAKCQTDPGEPMLKIKDDSTFKLAHGLTPEELVTLSEKGRVVPFFPAEYKSYDEKTIRPLLQPGIPRVSFGTMMVIRSISFSNIAKTSEWQSACKSAVEDIGHLRFYKEDESYENCKICLSVCYALGMKKSFEKSNFGRDEACMVMQALDSDLLDAVPQFKCPIAKKALAGIGKLPEGIDIEYVLKGLKINYSPKIPLEEYADVFDGKTSKAIRQILASLLKDPMSSKYTERLSAKIFDLNRQVDEIAESKTAEVFETISDIALYGGSKFVESQTNRLVRVPKKGLVRLGEWLASKGVDLTAKTQRKEWAVAQLYKAQCQLKKYK